MNQKESFLKHLQFEKRYSAYTLSSYKTDIDQFEAFCQSVDRDLAADNADFRIIRSWVVSMIENGLEARTVNRKITTLKSFYKYLLRQEVVSINPMDKVLAPKQSKRLPQFVEEDKNA